MAFPRLKEFAAVKGWRLEKNNAYGEENGYLFTLADRQGFKAFATPLPLMDSYTQRDILEFLKKNKKKLKYNEYLFDNDVLVIKFRESFRSTKIKVMNNLLEELTGFLRDQGVKGKESCIFCGKDGADETIYVDKIMYSAHNECYSHEVAAIDEAAREYDEENKNYFMGFIGALIGGIVSSIPWILVQVYLNRVAAFLALLIGAGALKAYGMFRGKMGRATRWIIGLCTLISVVFAQFGAIALEMVKYDIPLQYNNFLQVMRIPEVARGFKADIGLSLFMAFLGIAGLFMQLKGDTKSVLPNIEK